MNAKPSLRRSFAASPAPRKLGLAAHFLHGAKCSKAFLGCCLAHEAAKLDETFALVEFHIPEVIEESTLPNYALAGVRCDAGHEAYFRSEPPTAHFDFQIVLEVDASLVSDDAGDRTLLHNHTLCKERHLRRVPHGMNSHLKCNNKTVPPRRRCFVRAMVHWSSMGQPKTLDAKINALTRFVEKSFAALADDIAHRPSNSSVASIVENVVSPLLDKKLAPIHAELASIRRDLEDLRAKVQNVIEYRKEIDYALERIAAIEKHLGIERKIAA